MALRGKASASVGGLGLSTRSARRLLQRWGGGGEGCTGMRGWSARLVDSMSNPQVCFPATAPPRPSGRPAPRGSA